MVKGNIAAWTPERKNPPHVSINHVYRFTPMIEIVVREEASGREHREHKELFPWKCQSKNLTTWLLR